MEEQGIFIERILSNENMNRAYKQVKKNKGAAGIDGMECADLLSHLKVNGQQLRESIRNQSYKPMPVKSLLLWLMKPLIGSPRLKYAIFLITYPPCLLPVLC